MHPIFHAYTNVYFLPLECNMPGSSAQAYKFIPGVTFLPLKLIIYWLIIISWKDIKKLNRSSNPLKVKKYSFTQFTNLIGIKLKVLFKEFEKQQVIKKKKKNFQAHNVAFVPDLHCKKCPFGCKDCSLTKINK